MPKEIYFYYHAESDTLWCTDSDHYNNPDGCTEPVSFEEAEKILNRLNQTTIPYTQELTLKHLTRAKEAQKIMITLKINLRQLTHSLMTTPKGTKVIVIPITENNLFEGEKGLYLDIVGFERKEVKEGEDTHLLKQSFSKEKLAAMTDEAKKALPIIGNARVSGGQRSESDPKDANNGAVAAGVDDLPF